ncbi:MAG: TM2 domain-containing protein [Oscillospiraceae bacterium]|nr:TM2 domain-containing protein [Oscillospiraceae bacterium]
MADMAKVDSYIMANSQYFPAEKIPYLKEKLKGADDAKFELVISTELKSPTVLLIISLFLGWVGISRFMLGNIGYGIVKILFCWIFILTIVDWFLIMKKTRECNFNKLSLVL